MDTILNQTEVAVQVGMTTENDLLKVSAKKSEINYQMKKAENGAELCRLALCNAIGEDFSTIIIPTDTAPGCSYDSSYSTDISSRPELALLKHKVEASRQQVKLTLGDFLPTVGLSLRYNEGMVTLTDLMDAQNQWHQASSDFIEATTQYQIFKVEWLRAIGKLGED